MAFPVLLALAAVQAYSANKQAEEIRDAAEFQNELNQINAKYLEYDAHQAEIFGETEVAHYEPQISQTIAAQRVGFAAQDIDSTYGTAADFEVEAKKIGTLNIIEIQNNARMKAVGLRQQANNMKFNMKMNTAQAEIQSNAVLSTGLLNAAATGYRGYAGMNGGDPDLLGKSNKTSTRI